jgi:hypothetical protein
MKNKIMAIAMAIVAVFSVFCAGAFTCLLIEVSTDPYIIGGLVLAVLNAVGWSVGAWQSAKTLLESDEEG